MRVGYAVAHPVTVSILLFLKSQNNHFAHLFSRNIFVLQVACSLVTNGVQDRLRYALTGLPCLPLALSPHSDHAQYFCRANQQPGSQSNRCSIVRT
jgi:hypothetical protein